MADLNRVWDLIAKDAASAAFERVAADAEKAAEATRRNGER